MRHTGMLAAGAALLALGACVREAGVEPVPTIAEAHADVRDAGGRSVARATASPGSSGLRVQVEARGLAPGTYAVHVHAVGRCDPPGFESAGPHWNPLNREHGTLNPAGPHMGDLPNLLVGEDGQGTFEMVVADARLSGGNWGMLDRDGAAVVVHARPDDYRTDPSGNSGARIACGVFG